MQLVLLTFALLFSVLRICFTVTSEQSGSYRREQNNKFPEYRDEHCDLELEKFYENVLSCAMSSEDEFDAFWDLLEELKVENADKIAAMPDRTQKIWDVFVDGIRRPFAKHSCGYNSRDPRDWGRKRGFHCYPEFLFTNYRRALVCLMSLDDKMPLREARENFDILHGRRIEDYLTKEPAEFRQKRERQYRLDQGECLPPWLEEVFLDYQ